MNFLDRFSKNPQTIQVVPCRRMDRQTDMMKLIVAFHNFVNVPKNWRKLCKSGSQSVCNERNSDNKVAIVHLSKLWLNQTTNTSTSPVYYSLALRRTRSLVYLAHLFHFLLATLSHLSWLIQWATCCLPCWHTGISHIMGKQSLTHSVCNKVYFHLNGYVKSQHNRHLSAGNRHLIYEVLLHYVKFGVWCARGATRITGSIVFSKAINWNQYVTHILVPFVNNTNNSMCYLGQCFSTFVRPRPGKFFSYKTRAQSQQIYL